MFHNGRGGHGEAKEPIPFCFFTDGYSETGGVTLSIKRCNGNRILIVKFPLLMASSAWETSEDEM